VSSELGVSVEKIVDIPNYRTSPHFSEREKAALQYADCMTLSDQEVTAQVFQQIQEHYLADEIVELTTTIAWENCSSKFNRALRIDSQHLWKQSGE